MGQLQSGGIIRRYGPKERDQSMLKTISFAKPMIFAVAATMALSACTTAEQDVGVGAAVGAVAGAAIGGNVEGALIGGAAGALAGYLITRQRDGRCLYRDRRTGERYVTRCPSGY
jgi:trimethylamine:corrinoid methyltransferase-like protein